MQLSGREKNHILIIEPYHGGSHKLFLDGLQRAIPAEYTVLTLPARKWKMRMQLSSIWFVQEVNRLAIDKRRFDVVLSSTFVDLATLRILLNSIKGWNPETRFLTYFHENQFAYPGQSDEQLFQYQALNFTTALASDSIAFNSHYNMESFLKGCLRYVKKAVDMKITGVIEKIRSKSIVLYPGLDFIDLDALPEAREQDVPVIIWNHRWEHDKNPEEFFKILYQLQKERVPFKLVLAGQSFHKNPACFDYLRSRLGDKILQFGYINSRLEYLKWLKVGTVVVSTAFQEFFGISVMEAVRAGCRPLVPDRLSYRELFDQKFRYKEGELFNKLHAALHNKRRLERTERNKITTKYQWDLCKDQYERWLFSKNGTETNI